MLYIFHLYEISRKRKIYGAREEIRDCLELGMGVIANELVLK